MGAEPVRIEHRRAQRFDFHLPIAVRRLKDESDGSGFAQDISAGGVFFYTDLPLVVGDKVELTFTLPSEITLAEAMPVRCRGQVVRVISSTSGSKSAIAVRIQGYEYLPEMEARSEGLARLSAMHNHLDEESLGINS